MSAPHPSDPRPTFARVRLFSLILLLDELRIELGPADDLN
jgi:hypothetical protein